MSFSDTGKFWTPDDFRGRITELQKPGWVRGITMHHTAAPSLLMRPSGFLPQHLRNMRDFYAGMGWDSGPHLFVDDNGIWGMTPLAEKGTHARSFNGTHIGIEVLGDYDREDPLSGRGLKCWQKAADAVATLLRWICRDSTCVNFHREDPKTSKTCPGTKVAKGWFLDMVNGRLQETEKSGALEPVAVRPALVFEEDFVPAMSWLKVRGISEALKKTASGALMIGPHRIERHYYDKAQSSTYVSLRELEAIALQIKRAEG